MIIALSTDENVIRGARRLSALYPEEQSLRLESIVLDNYNLASSTENPIKRLTFLDHASMKSYGKMSVNLFTEHVIKILEENERRSPGFIRDLEAIDLLGCEIGQINQHGRSFALDVTQKLQEKGYRMPIYAFDNDNPQFKRTILKRDDSQWIFYGFESTEKSKAFYSQQEAINDAENSFQELSTEAYDKADEVEALEKQNSKLEKKAALGKANYKTQKNHLRESKQEEELTELAQEYKAGINRIRNKIQENNAKIEVLKSEVYAIADQAVVIRDKKILLMKEQESLGTRIDATDNPRNYFAKHPESNFSQKLSDFRKRFIPGEISREYRGNLQREKIRGDQHPLHHSNHHPRGH